jgi:hypothetical protein
MPTGPVRWCTNWMRAFLSTASTGTERERGFPDVRRMRRLTRIDAKRSSLEPVYSVHLLGIVEGLTEFLPVSSTAHLRITEALMKIPLETPARRSRMYWKMYTIVIQVGAIFALCLLFLERIVNFMRTFPKGEKGDRNWLTHPISLTLVAFACTSVPALLLHKWSEKNLGSLNASPSPCSRAAS